jgi:hypothetical protein
MKKCPYCGRENSDTAVYCRECGTQFVALSGSNEPAQSRERTWLEWLGLTLRFVGIVLAVGLVYLLSFGPVERYCGSRTRQTLPPATIIVNGQTVIRTSVRTVSRYPMWVGVVYRPAVMIRGNQFYEGYLRWWEDRPK